MNQRLLVPLHDGLAVEAVSYPSGTLCVSAQAGCTVGCPFCASGSRGLLRNLSAAELWDQIKAARGAGCEPQRVTVSGIGEPLHNLAAIFEFMTDCRAADLPVSLTTSGAPLARFAELLHAPHNGLMLSLHAATSAIRSCLVPAGPSPEALQQLLLAEWPRLARRRQRKFGINYLLLAGVNDGVTDLDALIDWLRPFPEATVHLLVYNPIPELNLPFVASAHLDRWHTELAAAGVHVRRSNRWRTQPEGGCGTLFVRGLLE